MRKKSMKILSLLLTLALLIGVLPGMTAYAAAGYGLRVGTKNVTDSNKNDVLGDGTVSFTPANGDTPATLTLSGARIAVEMGYGIEYTGREKLNIVLNGENKVSATEGHGIYCDASLSISGGGSLTVSGSYNGIFCYSTLEISGGSVDASGDNYAITSYGTTITISGGTVKATSAYTGIYSDNTITISGGTVTADAQSAGIVSPDITISGGTVTATGSQGNGIYCDDITISGGEVTAEGTGYGINVKQSIEISGGTVTAIGNDKAISGPVKNRIPGTGWTDTAGTKDETEIRVSAEPRDLSKFKKVEFKESAPSTGYTVTLWPNGGGGEAIVNTDIPEDTIYELPTCNFMPPEGKIFTGWKLRQDGRTYKPGQKFTVKSSLDFDAQWGESGGSRGGLSTNGADVVFNIPGMDDGWEYIGGGVPQRAYRLSFAPMQGGSAYFLLTSGENGETMNVYPQTTVRVVPTPDSGYRLASIVWSMIDGSASYDITESQTFVMPAMDAVVYVTFQPVA